MGTALARECRPGILDALGLRDVSERAAQLADTVEDNAAIAIGLRGIGIEVDREIEIDDGEVKSPLRYAGIPC